MATGSVDFWPAPSDPLGELRRGGGRSGRPRAPPKVGAFGCWVVSASRGEEASGSGGPSGETGPRLPCRLEALASVTCTYKPCNADGMHSGPVVVRRGRAKAATPDVYGKLSWVVEALYPLREPWMVPDFIDLDSLLTPRLLENRAGHQKMQDYDQDVTQFVNLQDDAFDRMLVLAPTEWMDCQAGPWPLVLREIPLGNVFTPARCLCQWPPKAAVTRWRRDARRLTQTQAVATAIEPSVQSLGIQRKYEVPALLVVVGERTGPSGLKNAPKLALDPLRLINAVSVSTHLRNDDDFGEAMDDMRRYENDDFAGESKRDRSRDPGRGTRFRSQRRLDVVGMAIERRLFHHEFEDDLVVAINCYSDSSPVVGTELQGMVVDVWRTDDTVRQVFLPGGSVFYGLQDAVNKVMVFMWSVWLCFGPELRHMRYFADHVVCWTTDFGVEQHSVEVPDMLDAFFSWLGGNPLADCARLVNWDRRLFYRSLRIGGWNHGFGNTMLRIAKVYTWWPEMLDHIRNLCRFFRNHTWRDWLSRALKDKLPSIDRLLQHFTATTAKWRFATIVDCMSQLEPLRFFVREAYVC